jgi:hypothetical protein
MTGERNTYNRQLVALLEGESLSVSWPDYLKEPEGNCHRGRLGMVGNHVVVEVFAGAVDSEPCEGVVEDVGEGYHEDHRHLDSQHLRRCRARNHRIELANGKVNDVNRLEMWEETMEVMKGRVVDVVVE